jgi:hypothetical protein
LSKFVYVKICFRMISDRMQDERKRMQIGIDLSDLTAGRHLVV